MTSPAWTTHLAPDDLSPGLHDLIMDLDAVGVFDWDGLDAEGVRRKFEALKAPPTLPDVARVEDIAVPGPGGEVPCRFYHPQPDTPLPLLVWYHGGGWVLGDLDLEEATARRLALSGDMAVLSVHYRLAPEHPFPAAYDDAFAAYRWAQCNANSLNCTCVAVGGGSSGGNLAAAVAIGARESGGEMPAHQLLFYPVVDADLDRPSMRTYADGPVLPRSNMVWFWDQYVPRVEERGDWRASPLRARNHAGLPPATIVLAEHDVLRDEGRAYAELLTNTGVPVECIVAKGMVHGFQGMASTLPEVETMVTDIAGTLGHMLAATPSTR